ncbi:MAG: helix-turn-helix domain-containing protein [Chitinophagaceae bacterium]|nr:MAG: helix-turn-helix domain-containing protein [Chitinophagaceae bacterium]
MKQLRTQLAMALLGYATQRDIDASRLFELADVSYDGLLRQPDISETQMDRLWYNAVQLSGDSLFGLHFGEQSQLAALGVVGEVVRTSFLILQAGARKKIALELLKTGDRTIGDIAYQLGYLETSAFIRAFRRWTGDSPTVYLQKQKAVVG